MKKGCFLTSIVLFTLVVGTIFYLFKTKYSTIKNFAQEKISEMAMKEIDEKIDKLNTTQYKDSLKILLHKKIKEVHHPEFDSTMQRVKEILEEAKHIVNQGKIDSLDYQQFRKFLGAHEGSEKN